MSVSGLHSSGKLLAAEKLSLYPGFSYIHQILPFRSKCAEDNFRPQLPLLRQSITFKARLWNVLEYIHNRLLFPCDQLDVAFCHSSLFDNVTVAIIELHLKRMKNGRLMTNILYCEVLFQMCK